MSLETVTLAQELRKLDEARMDFLKSEMELCNFILSQDFLRKWERFHLLLSEFRNKVFALVQELISALPQQPLTPQTQEQNLPKQPQQPIMQLPLTEKVFTLEKALVILAAIAGTCIVVQDRLLPPLALIGVVAACLTFVFAPQIRSLIEAALKKMPEEKEEIPLAKLEEWVTDQLSVMRNKYTSAIFLILEQPQKLESLPPQYKELQFTREQVEREEYLRRTLAPEFQGTLDKIVYFCNKNWEARKTFVISAMVQARQAASLNKA
ncbi:MAG: hypothetical protein K6T73_08960 [Candidatus Bathyarchaeota archaeon]|nr:hypothetical protein [Candidatus Bathyarchaeota archaeon]